MEAVHAATEIKTLSVTGEIIRGTNTSIKGHGTAEVILAHGKAIINFTAQITTAAGESDVFTWGLDSNRLTALDNNIPAITPEVNKHGTGVYYTPGGYISSELTAHGACFQQRNSYWLPERLYNTSGGAGAWPSNAIPINTIIAGTVYGTY